MSRIAVLPIELAQQTMASLHAKGAVTPEADCLIVHTSVVRGTSGSYRQVQVQQQVNATRSRGRPGKAFRPAKGYENQRVLVHQIALLAAKGERPGPGQDVSHLCHNASCCNPAHLYIEPHEVNMSRQRYRCPVLMPSALSSTSSKSWSALISATR